VRRAHIGIVPGAVVLSRHENLRQVSPRQKGVSTPTDVDESSLEQT